jgi:hypothetical protein
MVTKFDWEQALNLEAFASFSFLLLQLYPTISSKFVISRTSEVFSLVRYQGRQN